MTSCAVIGHYRGGCAAGSGLRRRLAPRLADVLRQCVSSPGAATSICVTWPVPKPSSSTSFSRAPRARRRQPPTGIPARKQNGSRVFFTEEKELTVDSGASYEKKDLYVCEVKVGEASGKLECDLNDLTPQSAGESAEVQGTVLGASEDGSSVYFVANGVLAPNAKPGDCRQTNRRLQPPATSTCRTTTKPLKGGKRVSSPRSPATAGRAAGENTETNVTGVDHCPNSRPGSRPTAASSPSCRSSP